MCILFIAINQHPDHPLIVCANRDEFYRRPTQAMHHWPIQHHDASSGKWQITAGKDSQAGGTWLGVAYDPDNIANGLRFSALTNIRDGNATDHPQQQRMRSRGELVSTALSKDSDIDLDWLLVNGYEYNPFNLIYQRNDISDPALFCYNSRTQQQQRLGEGFHAICNGNLNDKWPKMAKGEKALETIVTKHEPLQIDALLEIMQDQSTAPDALLPDTGVGIDWERRLSSIFIQSEHYGTRSTTLFFTHKQGGASLFELTYDNNGNRQSMAEFQLQDKHYS
ncbi:NRDE family protein [Thalassotalea mangrovi]|uniref:NRDE family protein n=1 Tax=Thalassotalea mangrovi TaxID=2572245 RepID=A0A4U1BA94_9GAMM|nr:NRDE family protein [Thalassotalea mangrovi]TKB47057.1 NRDE family protein [Thalassotalea mangrovi]